MELPIHLLGHSRGGSLITALAADLGAKGAWVDQLSPLDPVPVGSDAPINITDNVSFADNYFQTSFILHGNAAAGAHNVGPLSLPAGSNDHSDVTPSTTARSAAATPPTAIRRSTTRGTAATSTAPGPASTGR
jgi:hypothetical protein